MFATRMRCERDIKKGGAEEERFANLRAKWDGNGKETERLDGGKGGWEKGRKWVKGGGGGVEEDEMRPNFLWQSPCSCCRCWGHFTKAGPDANVISS